ncbi:multidrug resistance protein homolog 65-like [Sitodiplosis mosellana]|uniref:multidrug resistance protein homolog 65-like n=1 Tax=Sitodiplosis mosellana TaxID=263140 RepID=UPI002443C581|nr:multidrug resistance protein homolog 65-like [Sitodiplosis mosellana]
MKVLTSVKNIYQNDLANTDAVNYFSLYRFATKWDMILLLIGITATLLKSMALPIFNIIFGEYTSLLVDRTLGIGTSSTTIFLPLFGGGKILTNATEEENHHEIMNDTIAYGILLTLTSCLDFIVGIICVDCFNYVAICQITRIRIKFFESLMRQEIGWYDVAGGSNNLTVRIIENIEKIQDGIGEKVSHFLYLVMSFVICVVISFIYGWKLSLVMIAYVPIVIIMNSIIGRFQMALSTKELDSYSAASNVTEEVLSGIRTVYAFGGERSEIKRYNKRLVKAKNAVKLKGLITGIGDGIMRFLFLACSALAFWYGVRLVLDDRDKDDKEYTPTVLMITFLGLFIGADNIENTAPFLETFATACGSAASIFRVIDRSSKIDSMSNEGMVPSSNIEGNITFKSVHFSYPSRSDVQVLRGLDFKIQAGQSVALVGDSGNGKSTCLQLLQRFYDPDEGRILIDDYDIRTMNINVLRSNIATVGQEPVLFSTTIGDNIRYGNPDATDKDIVAAAQMSGAHDFVANLPQGYNTLVGEKGSKLSGGQKQRIAIARAMIQNPRILLLDEATSALDYQSEKIIQETLDKASKGRTTIVVSHRLSAIRNADRILFIDNGLIIEDGTHDQLMALKSRYFKMITAGRVEDANNGAFNSSNEDNVNDCQYSKNKNCVKRLITDKFDEKDHFHNLSADDMVKDTHEVEENIDYWNIFKRILNLARPQWLIILLAIIFACFIGSTLPIISILFGEIYGALSLENAETASKETNKICMLYLVVSVITFFVAICQTYWFSEASVELATRVRSMTFAALLQQNCAWFDDENNSTGALSARLTSDAGDLQDAIGNPLNEIIRSFSTFAIGIFVAFGYSVKLSIACMVAFPLSLLTVILEARHMSKISFIEKQSLEISMKIATEAISNIRTVAGLRQEKFMIDRYVTETRKMFTLIRKKIAWRGFVNSLAQTIPTFANALTLCYGGFLVINGEIHFKNVIKVTEALLYATIEMSHSLVHIPSLTAAFVGAHRIFQIIDRTPQIKSPIIQYKQEKPNNNNRITYNKIYFRYPTRPDVQILENFNLDVMEGRTIALIGSSGCGKSTCIQLLQRLYEPQHGRIHIGLDEISRDVTIKDLRSKLSIVSQEPVLFDRTIAENIAYGDNSRKVSMGEIRNAARMANVHNFINQLPMGYETNVGNKTAQLSGGQKQRIAIARALIRNPKILLLDEATSALDVQSEQIVQQALNSARSGRTCLVIAHRLSTVQNADAICVLHGGNIVEYGTHTELLALGGRYTNLYNAQK